MRVLLFAGKGGAGTTTVAAATALAAARHGVKTLVLATDRAPALGDLLGVDDRPGVPQEVESSFFVLRPDPGAQLLRTWPGARHRLAELTDGLSVPAGDVAGALGEAGASPVLSLLTLAEQVRHGPWDLLVVDAGTGPEALRLLTIADDVLRVADGLWSPERRLGLRLRRPHPIVSHVVSRLRGELAEARSVLRTPTTSVRLVLSPERAAVTHARRTATALTVRGYAVDGVVATRVLTDETAWPRPLVAAQRELLDATETAFAPTAVHRVPYLLAEPAREALAALGDGVLGATPERGGGVERALAPVVVPQPRVRRADDVFELVVAVPFVSAADVDLVRHGDELHLSVPGTRHVIALPSVLRRCLVTGASVADGRLVVRFEPDPSLWPQPSSAGEGAGPEVVR